MKRRELFGAATAFLLGGPAPKAQGVVDDHVHRWELTPFRLADVRMEVYPVQMPSTTSGSPQPIGVVENLGPSIDACTICGVMRCRMFIG
jgi:hypothetical protein